MRKKNGAVVRKIDLFSQIPTCLICDKGDYNLLM